MPNIVDEAICVRHWDFSETSQTVSLLTRAHGTLRGLAKGAKRERGRFSGGIDLLTRGEVVAIVKSGRELATLTDWDLRQTWRVFRERLAVNRAAFYLADLASRLVGPDDPHPEVFDALVRAFDDLQACGLRDPAFDERFDLDRALLRFQSEALGACGYGPELGDEPLQMDRTFRFAAAEGGIVVAEDPASGCWPVRAETVGLLREVAAGGDCDDASAETVSRAARLLAAYAREVLGHEPATMRAVFGDLPLPRSPR